MTLGEKMIWAAAYVAEFNRSERIHDGDYPSYLAVEAANVAVWTVRKAIEKIENRYGEGAVDFGFLEEMIGVQ